MQFSKHSFPIGDNYKEFPFQNHDFQVQGNNILLIDDENKNDNVFVSPINEDHQIIQDLTQVDVQPKLLEQQFKGKSKQITGLAKIFSNLVVQQNISLFRDKLIMRKKLFSKLKYRHHQIINDKSYDIHQFDPDEPDEQDDNIWQFIGTHTIKRFKNRLNRIKRAILKSKIILQIFEKFDIMLSKITIITPESYMKWIWDIILGVIRIFFIIMIPIQLAFNNNILSQTCIEFTVLSSILFIFDIFIRLDTAFFKMGVLQTSRWEIFKQYSQHGLISDILSVSCLLFINISTNLRNQDEKNERQFADFLQLIFFTQFRHLKVLKRQAEESMNLSITKLSIYNIVKLLFTLLLIEHFFCCVWAFIGLLECENNYESWVAKREIENSYWLYQYLEAIYYTTVTMITVGYGDIVPITAIEKIFCIIFMIFSSIQLSYSVNLVGNTISNLMADSDASLKKMRILNYYLRRKKINNKLRNQIREYLIYFWAGQNNQQQEEQQIINQLSEELKGQLDFESNNILFEHSEYFKKNFSQDLMKELSKHIKSLTVSPDNLIPMHQLNQSDNTYFYFIEAGSVLETLLTQDTNNPIVTNKKIRSSHIFGLQEFFSGCPSGQQYKSVGFTKLLQLSRQDFLQVIERYPKDYEQFCMIKDKILLQNRQLKKTKCGYCKQYYHSIATCPAFHFIPDKEKIIKSYLFPKIQERNQESQRFDHRFKVFNGVVDQQLVEKTVQEFKGELENPYITDSDSETENKIQIKYKNELLTPINHQRRNSTLVLPEQLQSKKIDLITQKQSQRIIQIWEMKNQIYKQRFKEIDLNQFETLYLRERNFRQFEILNFDTIMNYQHYFHKQNAQNILKKQEKRKILNKFDNNQQQKERFTKYMLFPYNFRLKYQIPFEQENIPKEIILSNERIVNDKKEKKRANKQNKLSLFVSGVRKNQVIPGNQKREKNPRKKTKKYVTTG